MIKTVLISLGLFLFCKTSFAQIPKNTTLFVIDSIPILNDPEEWNSVLDEDIADISVVKGKDTLALLGYKKLDGIIYIFTKEYRNRPDSLKIIPSLKQMVMQNGIWHLGNIPYSGRYICAT